MSERLGFSEYTKSFLEALIECLPPQEHEALRLVFYEQHTQREAAQKMDTSDRNIRRLLTSAQHRLKPLLAAIEGLEDES